MRKWTKTSTPLTSGVTTIFPSQNTRQTFEHLLVLIPVFLIIQALVILMHEFTHSTVAWLLDDMHSPWDIVWGNPVMMTGWDEGVGYRKLFAMGRLHQAAIIGVSPLIMHTVMVALSIIIMLGNWVWTRKRLFYVLFWFAIVNLMELIAYVLMRGFADHGDTGNFNRGMEISPWFLFVFGSLFLMAVVFVLYGRAFPIFCALLAPNNRNLQWAYLVFSALALFLWGSGIRVLFYVYPDPQYLFGLLGVAGFAVVLYLFGPKMQDNGPAIRGKTG